MNQELILASASPRRKQLLGMLYTEFIVVPSHLDEPDNEGEDPAVYAETLARLKAHHVAEGKKESLIIGSDTIVVLGERILGKPKSDEDAAAMLQALSGNTHRVITSICLAQTDAAGIISKSKTFHETTQVRFAVLSDDEIRAYISTGSPLDKAGAYGIQDDLGALLIERIDGDYYTVVGFPLRRYYVEMKAFAPNMLPETFQP